MDRVTEFLDDLGDQLSGLTNGDLVVGSKLVLGNTTIVPLSKVSLGFGGGGGGGEERAEDDSPIRNSGTGGGTGGGGSVKPVAVAVFRDSGVEIMRVPEKTSSLSRLLEKLPDLVDKLKS